MATSGSSIAVILLVGIVLPGVVVGGVRLLGDAAAPPFGPPQLGLRADLRAGVLVPAGALVVAAAIAVAVAGSQLNRALAIAVVLGMGLLVGAGAVWARARRDASG